jgi:ribosomal protein L11 methyltransferase
MPDPSATAVARLSTDQAAARRIGDALAEVFDGETVAASTFEEPDGHWSLAVHFRDQPNEDAVRALVEAAAGVQAAQSLAFETLAPTDWVRKSLAGLTPVDAGRFVVHGAHDRARVRANRIGIEIEAALAFGTGHHGTTRGCLLALDRIAKGRRARRVLDVGTGTGVLAIAAAKALRRPVLASDIDARSVAIARDNARLNHAGAHVEIVHAAGLGRRRFVTRGPYALIFANILLEPLQRLATPMSKLVAPNGRVVLSGLLAGQAGVALASYRARGLVLERRIRLEGWVTLVLVRPGRRP